MKFICDVCERAPARWFCAVDEAALCSTCDKEVGCANCVHKSV